tara:strand:+ start:124 stop:387 length:264 start_codon:yes stop_codon:yes gene_type:complete
MTKQKDILQSNEAEIILNSETFKKSIENLRQEYVKLWLESKGKDDIDWRENLHSAINILPEVEKHLRIIIEKGKITKAQVERLRKVV